MESLSQPNQFEKKEQIPSSLSIEATPFTLMDTELGGKRLGGEMSLLVDNPPVVSREEGFVISGLPADLLAVVKPGANEMQINTLGVVKTRLAGNTSEKDDILLVNLLGNREDGYTVEESIDTKKPRSARLQTGNPVILGRDTGNSYGDLNIRKDPSMSGKHLSIEIENDVISIRDTKSLNGTIVTTMGTPERFTIEDLDSDMSKLREELGLEPKEKVIRKIGSEVLKNSGADVVEVVDHNLGLIQAQQEKITKIQESVPSEIWTKLFQYASQKSRIERLADEGVKDHRFMQNELSRAIELEKRIPTDFHQQAADLVVLFSNLYKMQQ